MSSGSSNDIKAEALRLGFFACGIARACPVREEVATAYRQWIAEGRQAGMHYLEDHLEKRLDPTLLVPGARSVIVMALNYTPPQLQRCDTYQIARYAYGKDYHDVLRQRLRQLLPQLSPNSKIATDTVPVLERYWAVEAGLGFIGRNHQLIIPKAGSQFFLGEIITDVEFDLYDRPLGMRCPATCRQCVDACPTGVLSASFDAAHCLSYQTIENRGAIPSDLPKKMGDTIYGCDRCTAACPFNAHAPVTNIAELMPSDELLQMTKDDWRNLSVEDYRRLFKGSAVKRAKYEGLLRNIQAVNAQEEPPENTAT